MSARCEYCRKTIRAGRAISTPTGLLFDSLRCRDRYLRGRRLKDLQNAMRVARSRLKARAISKAEALYQELGEKDWPTVEEFLRALL